MGLELQSLSFVQAPLRRDSVTSTEAGMLFVLGALSSGLLLYGASGLRLYGSTDFATIIQAAGHGDQWLDDRLGSGLSRALHSCQRFRSICGHLTFTKDRQQFVTAFFATAPAVAAMPYCA